MPELCGAEEVEMARIRIAVDELHCRPEVDVYRQDTGGQTYAQFWINPAARTCGIAQESGAPGNATDADEWHDRILTHAVADESLYPSQYPVEADARKYLRSREGQASLRRVCDGHEIEWDGNNHVGRLSEDAAAAWDALCAAVDGLAREASYVDAGDWVVDASVSGVTVDMTDTAIDAMAGRDAKMLWAEERVVVGGLADRYREIRDELREDADV